MAKKTESHTGFRNGKMFCFHCGGWFDFKLRQPINVATDQMRAFDKLHKHCQKIWVEPVNEHPNLKTMQENIEWWIENGEHGTSALTILKYAAGVDLTKGSENHPYDTSDFYRCHKLIQAVPQLFNRLGKLQPLSPVWDKLVSNWGTLSGLLIKQINSNKDEGLYQKMKDLGC